MTTILQLIYDHPQATDAEIAALFNAHLPAYRRVPAQDVKQLLTDRRLNGPLRLARDNTALPVTLRAGVIEFLATLDNFDVLDATDVRNRSDAQTVTAGLVQAGVIGQTDADAFDAMLVDSAAVPTSADAVAGDRAAAARASAFAAVRSRWAAIYNAGVALIDSAADAPAEAALRAIEVPTGG